MPQQYRKKNTAEPKSILQARSSGSVESMTPEQGRAIGGLVTACIKNGNAVYIQPGRYGSLTFKVYIEGEQFAEALFLDNTLNDLCEQIIDALYEQDDVAWMRRTFAGQSAERPAETRKEAKP
jgi:hypothetical protein